MLSVACFYQKIDNMDRVGLKFTENLELIQFLVIWRSFVSFALLCVLRTIGYFSIIQKLVSAGIRVCFGFERL